MLIWAVGIISIISLSPGCQSIFITAGRPAWRREYNIFKNPWHSSAMTNTAGKKHEMQTVRCQFHCSIFSSETNSKPTTVSILRPRQHCCPQGKQTSKQNCLHEHLLPLADTYMHEQCKTCVNQCLAWRRVKACCRSVWAWVNTLVSSNGKD